MGCGGCASASERCGNGLEKIYPTTAVRYGKMRHIGEFSHAPDLKFTCGAKVVISTDRGIEIGEQVSLTCFGCDRSVSREQMRAYAQASGGDALRLKAGRILREATPADLAEWQHIQSETFNKLQVARRIAAELELPMKVVDCEHLFGGERIVFYFMAEQRVDFRELVHRLAAEFQTRIEMRQVGARDEARLLADYETCGREVCCKAFIKTLKPVSMSMAKVQKTTLDLSKVSGRCGRLKCCLRFEHESYESLEKNLPRLGSHVKTAHGAGQVVDRQVLTQLVKIRTYDGKFVTVVAEDILERNLPAPPPPPREGESGGDGRGRSRDRRPEPKQNGDGSSGRSAGRNRPKPATPEAAPQSPPQQPQASAPNRPPEPGAAPAGESPRRGRRRRRRRKGGGAQDGAAPSSPQSPPPG